MSEGLRSRGYAAEATPPKKMFRFCDFTKMIKHVRSLRSWGYAAEATPPQKKSASSFPVGIGAVAPPPLPFGVWTEAHPCFENDKKKQKL